MEKENEYLLRKLNYVYQKLQDVLDTVYKYDQVMHREFGKNDFAVIEKVNNEIDDEFMGDDLLDIDEVEDFVNEERP